MRRADRLDAACDRDRVRDEFLDGHARVGDAVDEGRVRPVLEQTPHEIGEQRLVRADRGVDAARAVELVAADHCLVQRLAHAVQALELVLPAVEVRPGHGQHRGKRLGVVGRELRVDRVGRREQLPRRREEADVGVDLAGEDREPVVALDLRPLDLRVPVRALHQPDHQPPAGAPREVDEPVDDEDAALAVGLDDEAEAVPVGEVRIEAQRLENIERKVEPVGLLGVDVEADVVGLGERREALDARQKLAHDPGALDALIARMQRRQLDRNARPLVDAAPVRGPSDRMHGVLVLGEVARRVLGRGRRFAEHVVGKGEAARLALAARVDGLLDGAPGDELLAHEPHGHVDPGPDDRLAAPADETRQRGAERLLAAGADQLSGQHEAPGGGVDEQRRAVSDMGAPVARRELVADQRVARGGVGNAQQRLRETHQRHALLARQRVLVDEPLDAAGTRLGAQPGHETARHRLDAFRLVRPQRRQREERGHALRLGFSRSRRDRGAQRRFSDDLGTKRGEGVFGHLAQVGARIDGFKPDRTPSSRLRSTRADEARFRPGSERDRRDWRVESNAGLPTAMPRMG